MAKQNQYHNKNRTCWNCPAAKLKGNVDFRACGQSKKIVSLTGDEQIMIECQRRPELGRFEPNITFSQCPQWLKTKYGYFLKNMRVMILGLDGYLGWTLALKLAQLGCQISGIDNYTRRDCLMEKGSHTIVPIARMTERLQVAKRVLGISLNFRKMDIMDRKKLREFLEEEKPEAIVHYAEIPSAPYSMVDAEHAIRVQNNNVLGTLGLLWSIKDIVPTASLIKLGTMGEYGLPLTGRPLYEGIFPADAVLKWGRRQWSLGGELTPRDPVSFYHCCYDNKTKVLTEKGWRYFKEIVKSDSVLTWNTKTNQVEYEKPQKIVNYAYRGKMYNLKHRKVHLTVTPNHRMIVGNKTRKQGIRWKPIKANQIEKLFKFYNTGIDNWQGAERDIFTLPEAQIATTHKKGKYYYRNAKSKNLPMDDWLRFFAWFISEGNVYQPSHSKYIITIAQDNKITAKAIKSLIERIGYHPNTNTVGGKIKGISICDSQLGQYLKQFGKSNEKYIPRELLMLSKRQLKILLDTLLLGDGSEIRRNGRSSWIYYTASQQLANDVQEIALKVGVSAIINKGRKRYNYDEYRVYMSLTTKTQVNELHNNDGWVNYKGKVYCCTVKNGTLLVKKDGRPVWCGNSKVQDTFNVYEACKYWWIRSYDVMQGVIYGVHTPELAKHPKLRTRFDIDEWFGTVINRFVAQAILGIPLTIYGGGEQIRGFIALEDAMECMVRLLASPPEPGQYAVVNQVSGLHKINDLAETVARVAKKFRLKVKIQRLENPRVEAEDHPLEVVSQNLPGLGFEPKVSLEKEISRMFKLLTRPAIKRRIEEKAHVILPKTRWSGEKKESDILEIYQPGTKKKKGYQGILKR